MPDGQRVLRAFSGSTYAHELMHYHTYRRTGDVDVGHWRGDWELADETAVKALNEAGL
jgi:predicted SprT family Zn-dependent metalloprotease